MKFKSMCKGTEVVWGDGKVLAESEGGTFHVEDPEAIEQMKARGYQEIVDVPEAIPEVVKEKAEKPKKVK